MQCDEMGLDRDEAIPLALFIARDSVLRQESTGLGASELVYGHEVR